VSGLDLAGFAAVLALLLWVGRRATTSADAYLVADRSIRLFPLVATLVMTEFNTSTLLAFSAMGYSAGPAIAPFVFWLLLFYTLSVAHAALRSPECGRLFTERPPSLSAASALFCWLTGFSAMA
jgi:Na+/proline symporter